MRSHFLGVTLALSLLLLMAVPLLDFSSGFSVGVNFSGGELPLPVRTGKQNSGYGSSYSSNEVVIKFERGVGEAKIASLGVGEGAEEVYVSAFSNTRIWRVPPSRTVEDWAVFFSRHPLVEYAEPNYLRYAFAYPDDPFYVYQWHFDDDHTINPSGASSNPFGGFNGGGVGLEDVWSITNGSSNVVVAVVDTGIAYEDYAIPRSERSTVKRGVRYYQKAPDLDAASFWVNSDEIAGNGIDDDGNGFVDDLNGWDFINGDAHPNDNNGHGTHVTGTVAQASDNGLGAAGITPDTTVMPVKVLNYAGNGSDVTVADGIYYAVDNGADVINLSLGGSSPSSTLEDAVAYAYDHGVVVVASSGNGGAGAVGYPAAYDSYVIAVGATRYDENRAPYSNFGVSLDLVAPGGDLNADQNEDGYGDGVLQQTFKPYEEIVFPPKIELADPTDWEYYYFFQGTSMAAPHVSGVAALLLARDPTLTPDEVRYALESTAEDLGDPGRDDVYGWGLIDAKAALQSARAIYIRADGSIDPPTAPIVTGDNITYTLTGNHYNSIVVERDNIIVDGAGYVIMGNGTGVGVQLFGRQNITITDMTIRHFEFGINLVDSFNNKLTKNNVANNIGGISTGGSWNNTLSENKITANSGYGIKFSWSSYTTVSGNNITDNGNRGIVLVESWNIVIEENSITNDDYGIYLESSQYINISKNIIADNDYGSYSSGFTHYNTFFGNNITNNMCGIALIGSNYDGYPTCENNTLSENVISANGIGLNINAYSTHHVFFHNCFVDNVQQMDIDVESDNVWDDGYPSGGNYWSDYAGVDLDGDGIGDTPYIIDADNQDRYPLMNPWPSSPRLNVVPLSGWLVDEGLTNAPYVLDSSVSGLSLELDPSDAGSRVTVYSLNGPKLNLSDYGYVNVSITGSSNARILLRFFLDDGSSFDVVYWKNPATLDAVLFDLGPYAGRSLSGLVYVALMSSDGELVSVDISEVAFEVAAPPSPLVPLSGWLVDEGLTNAPYTLGYSSLHLELDAVDTGSRVTVYSLNGPKLNLSDYGYVNVTATGSGNARVLLRFFLVGGGSFDVVYWKGPATLDAVNFDLSVYSGRTLRGDAYVALMSSDGTTASIDITEIAFEVSAPLVPSVPLSGWVVDSELTNAPHVLSSGESSLSLELDAADTSSRVTIYTLNAPKLSLSDYAYVNVSVTGTANARVLLRFFLDNTSSFDVVYWAESATLDSKLFDLGPYAGRTLRGDVYVAIMSSDGSTASIEIAEIAFENA